MFIAPHEWLPATHQTACATGPILAEALPFEHARLFQQLSNDAPAALVRADAADFVRGQLKLVVNEPCGLPDAAADLGVWMAAAAQSVQCQYRQYLEQRRQGASRRFFSNRAHALYFLRSVAPTKLVDGAWLYGVLVHWRNPRFTDLVKTYVDELGEGAPDKNHVLLYRSMLARHGLEQLHDLPDDRYRQGLVQLALGWNAEIFLPEVIGFNLAYEQLPLHLLISAYELNELGLDPYYFTLHVTVDNLDTGHARRACQAVWDTLPRLDDGGEFWRRVREGAKLSEVGVGTTQVIHGFDIEAEVLRILAGKSGTGHGAHSDYCRVAGRSVNEWLSSPANMPGFVQALQSAGWIKRGEPAQNSRFWKLLLGERAEMFGVFSSYELQVIYDWLRGEASADGQSYVEGGRPSASRRRLTFRAAAGQTARHGCSTPSIQQPDVLDADLALLRQRAAELDDDAARKDFWVRAMSPAQHWTPAGLYATRLFCRAPR